MQQINHHPPPLSRLPFSFCSTITPPALAGCRFPFGSDWKIKTFVRGTLRHLGWKNAWKEIFEEIDQLDVEKQYGRIQEMSDELWQSNSYGENESDRVVLNVSFKASKNGVKLYHKSYLLDAWGNRNNTAMARLVSIPVSLAVEAVN